MGLKRCCRVLAWAQRLFVAPSVYNESGGVSLLAYLFPDTRDKSPLLLHLPFLMIEDIFSFMSIVKVLALFRAKEANLRHRDCFYWQRFKGERNPCEKLFSDVSAYLPPRRDWSRPKKKQRHSSHRPTVEILRDSIYRKVQGVYHSGRLGEYEWGRKLAILVKQIQDQVASGEVRFSRPELMLRLKAVSMGCRPKYRCISAYRNLTDRVILTIANKYLTTKFDPVLSKNTYAFRIGKSNPVAHTVGRIINYRQGTDALLYVAEYDIIKFFDTIGHNVVLNAFEAKCKEVAIDDRVRSIVKSFLKSYCIKDVLQSTCWRELAKHEDWNYLASLPNVTEIGLPQGGALSGLLANIVLDLADKAVDGLGFQDLLYIRYCDDIIIISKDEERCRSAVQAFSKAVEQLCLCMYPAGSHVTYGRDYYSTKSKGLFRWGHRSTVEGVIPWVSFLGYSIRYDGAARLRKETFVAHVKSIKEECNTFLTKVNAHGFRSLRGRVDVVKSFLFRLISKGTGRITIEPIKGLGRCWLSAFRFLGNSDVGLRQIRKLDYVRTSEINRLLRKLGMRYGDVSEEDDQPAFYFGKPFSYVGSCERLSRNGIADNRGLGLSEVPDVKHSKTFEDVSVDQDGKIPDNCEAQIIETDDDSDDYYDMQDELYDEEYETSGWERASGR